MVFCPPNNTIFLIIICLIVIYLLNNKNSENFIQTDSSIETKNKKKIKENNYYKKINYKKIIRDKSFYKEEFCKQRANICKNLITMKKDIDKNINEFTVLKDSTSGSIKDYMNEKKNKFFIIKEKLDDLVKTSNEEFRCYDDKKKSFNRNCNNSSEDSPDESPEDNIYKQ